MIFVLYYDEAMLTDAGHTLAVENDLAIFRLSDDRTHYDKLISVVDTVNKEVSAPITSNGQYIIGYDINPPELGEFIFDYNNADGILSLIISDDFAGVDTISLFIDDIEIVDTLNQASYYDTASRTLTYDFAASGYLTEGIHTMYAVVTDSEDNSVMSDTASIYIDATLPTIDSVSQSTDAEGNLTINFSANDNTDIAVLYFTSAYTGTDILACEEMLAVDATSVTVNAKYLPYSIDYKIVAYDSAGNKCEYAGAHTVTHTVLETVNLPSSMTLLPNDSIEIEFNMPILEGSAMGSVTFRGQSVDAQVYGTKLVITPLEIQTERDPGTLIIPADAVTNIISNGNSEISIEVTFFADIADLNKDGTVELLDLVLLAQNYGLDIFDDEFVSSFDLNENTIIGLYDLVIVAGKIE